MPSDFCARTIVVDGIKHCAQLFDLVRLQFDCRACRRKEEPVSDLKCRTLERGTPNTQQIPETSAASRDRIAAAQARSTERTLVVPTSHVVLGPTLHPSLP